MSRVTLLLRRCFDRTPAAFLAMLLLIATAPAMARASTPGFAAGFEIDGNLVCSDTDGWVPAVPFGEDWHSNPMSMCAGVIDALTCVPNPARLPSLFVRDPHWAGSAKDASHFDGGSNKNNDNISAGVDPWSQTEGSGPQKNDLAEYFVHSRSDINGDLWIMLGASTRATNGDSHIDFEFNRAGLSLDTSTQPGVITGLGPNNGRTIGDVLISIDYENGGVDPIPSIHRWDGTTYVDLPLPEGSWFAATNETFAAAAPCGATQPDGSLSTSYTALQFAEVALNLDIIGLTPGELCSATATLMVKTRSSQEFTAELKDFNIQPFSIVTPPTCSITGPTEVCAGQTVELCGPDGFDYSWTGPNGFASTARCITVGVAGTYALVVTDQQNSCESAPCTLTLTVNDPPACNISGPEPVCPGSTNVYSGPAGSGLTYAWSISGNGSISGPTNGSSVSVLAGAACNQSYTLDLTVTSPAGCQSTCSRSFLVNDTTAPVISGVGGPATIECPNTPMFSTPSAADACDPNPSLVPNDVTTPGACPQEYSVTRTWTATDACGNSSTASQTITVEDNTAPVISGVGGPATIECPNTPQFSTPSASDACDPNPSLVPNDVTTPGACTNEYSVTRTWTATDACGNSSTASQTITVEDNTPPTFTCPPDIALQCGDSTDPANTGSLLATDACGGVFISYTDAPTSNCTPFPGIDRTWVAVDACGNLVSCVQSITFVDTTPPTITCPPNVEVGCTDPTDPSSTGNPTVVDNCGGGILVDFIDRAAGTPDPACAGQPIERVWRAVDSCGNSAVCVQIITIVDRDAPVITCPSDISSGECNNIITFGATATDVCDAAVDVVCVPPSGSTFPVGETTVTCTATDDCGNQAGCSFKVTIQANPVCAITGPESICAGGTAQLCGPAGANLTYAWTGPGGFVSAAQCIDVMVGGVYNLTVTDNKGCVSNCSHTLTVNDLPVCSISGPSEICAGETADLCGPAGNYMYSWTGPGGFVADTQCITVGVDGNYTLVLTDLATRCVSAPCSQYLTVEVCVVNCPRTAGFWSTQCALSGTGSQKFTLSQLTSIASCIDDKVGIFNWGANDFSGWCSAVSNGGQMNQRRQAKRQFAAFLANVCTGELGLIANNGDVIFLNLNSPVSCSGLNATTIGGLITEADATLLQLEGMSLSDPVVKAKYSQLIQCLDAINNAEGVGTVCRTAAAQNAEYRDYVSGDEFSGSGDLVELYRPSPNPFAHATRIAYVVRGTGESVDIGIFDLAGRKVRTLASGFQAPGRYELTWDGSTDEGARVNNGVYFVRSHVSGQQKSMQVIYLK